MNYEQVRFHTQRLHESEREEKETIICLALNNQETRLVIGMADFLIKAIPFW